MKTPGYSNNQANDFDSGVYDAGLTGTNKVVFTHISACRAEQGISIQELHAKTRNLGEQQLRLVLPFFLILHIMVFTNTNTLLITACGHIFLDKNND